MLKVRELSAGYGEVQVLWGVDLEVKRGEIVTLVGSNGAGKTTLLKVLSGLILPTSGEILFEDHSVTNSPPDERVRLGIAHVPEGRRLFAGMTVEENLKLGAYLRRDEEVGMDLERVFRLFPELKARRRSLAGTLSGGEQQMCALGRALMSRPKLLLIDELSLGLAPVVVDRLLEAIHRIRAGGTTLLIVEQDVQTALEHADRAYVLESGRIVLEGEAADLLDDARIRNAYLGL